MAKAQYYLVVWPWFAQNAKEKEVNKMEFEVGMIAGGLAVFFIIALFYPISIVYDDTWNTGFCASKGMTIERTNTTDESGSSQFYCVDSAGKKFLFDSRTSLEKKKAQKQENYCDSDITCGGKLK